MLKIFSSKEERHRFIDKAMVSEVSQFLDEDIVESIDGIVAPFGMGKVIDTGYIDTRKYIGASLEHFGDGGSFIDARVTHSEIEYGEGYLSYGGRRYERVIFCEGYHAMENPLFAELRLKPAKGELLKVKIAGLTQEWAIAKGVGLIPIGEQSFIVGSTYNWEDRTEATTAVAKDYLLERLGELLDLDYEVVGHEAGIRPSSFDRRPILGQSRVWNGAYIFHGLGTKGIMYAPYYADMLLGNIEDGKAIDEEVDYARML
jgi:glycine/D-amino acid oxidase-like deaminating enzyme